MGEKVLRVCSESPAGAASSSLGREPQDDASRRPSPPFHPGAAPNSGQSPELGAAPGCEVRWVGGASSDPGAHALVLLHKSQLHKE